jgi:hypothetical protein
VSVTSGLVAGIVIRPSTSALIVTSPGQATERVNLSFGIDRVRI